MRALNSLRVGLGLALAAGSAALAQPAPGNFVAASWHFAGASRLARDTNFANLTNIFALQSSGDFRNLVLTRLSAWLAASLPFPTNRDSASLVRPLLDDLLLSESFFAMGGRPQGPLSFILAVQLDDKRAQAWQDNLRQALGGSQGDTGKDFPGRFWRAGGKVFWMDRDRDWLMLGVGEDPNGLQGTQYGRELSAGQAKIWWSEMRDKYAQEVGRSGRPGPPLGASWLEADSAAPPSRPLPPRQNWLEADVDWPRLAQWLPAVPFSFKPARAQIAMTIKDGSMRMRAKVTYPQPIPWKFDPWRVPTNVISVPLSSFNASQDLAALMNSDQLLSKLADNPLAGQLYVWSMGQMGLQTYASWPVPNATNTLRRLASDAPAAFNPDLAAMKSGSLDWLPDKKTLAWEKLGTLVSPTLQVASETNGQFLLASLFPLAGKNIPPPSDLLNQFAGRTNLVYYGWEQTGLRLQEWRLLEGMLPILPKSPDTRRGPPVIMEEAWLSSVAQSMNNPTNFNTVTEITLSGPDELTVVRKSPFCLTSLELVVASHWLTGTGSPGINLSLMPPAAKVTGPGINPNGH